MTEQTITEIHVNGERVPEELIEHERQSLLERYGQVWTRAQLAERGEQILADARENALERVLLMQEARTGMPPPRSEEVDMRKEALMAQHGGQKTFLQRFQMTPEELEEVRSELEDSLRVEQYIDRICETVERPTEADARAAYDADPEQYVEPEAVHVAHIVQRVSPQRPVERVYAELLNLREQILRGEDFLVVAERHSDCGQGDCDLGYIVRGEMVPSFENVAFNTPPGHCSDVFQTPFGYHILRVFDHRPARELSFDEVRYDIEAHLHERRKNEAVGVVVDQLRERAEITYPSAKTDAEAILKQEKD